MYPDDGLILHYQAYALYREATFVGARGKDASPILERALGILEKSAKSRIHAGDVQSDVVDRRTAHRPRSVARNGARDGVAAASQAALTRGPGQSARLAESAAWGLFILRRNTAADSSRPRSISSERLRCSRKDTPKPGEPAWGRAEAFAWLGQVYEKSGDKTKAAETYKTAISIAPNYAFAKFLAAALK